MSSGRVVGLQFRCRELVEETAALREMAAELLVWDQPLREHERDLERIGRQSIKRDRDPSLRLQPLRTRPTRDYEHGGRSGGRDVYALMRGEWQVRAVGMGRPKRRIAFTGKAWARVELWPAECQWCEEQEENQIRRLGMWRIELGARDSPGCYFHFQILGDSSDNPFPKSIPVPRLPSPFVTPMSAVEFVLGELFQDKWHRLAGRTRHHQERWRAIQRQRWCDLLQWHEDAVYQGTSSPWMNLKAAKPPDGLFLSS